MNSMELIFLNLIGIYLGAFTVIIMLFLVLTIVFERKRNQKVKELLEKVAEEQGYTLEDANDKTYDYELINEESKILIKLVFVPTNSSITINSKNTWCLRYGGSAHHRGYSNMKYLDKLIPFLEKEIVGSQRKVLLVYPDTNKIQRYLNESEIAILKPGDKVYDYQVFTFPDFTNRFQDLQ